MLIKVLKSVADPAKQAERDRYANFFGSTRSLVVIAIEMFPGKVVFWLDHAGVLMSVRSDLVDIVDGSLSSWWRVSTRSGRLFIGPPEIASEDFDVDPTGRSEASNAAYALARARIFEEAEKIDPEAHDVRRFRR